MASSGRGSIWVSKARTQGRQAAKRSATEVSVMRSTNKVKWPATSRSDLSSPQYSSTSRSSCMVF